jgi:hypothetical protein
MGEESITQVGFVETIADVMQRPSRWCPRRPRPGANRRRSARTSPTTATPCTPPRACAPSSDCGRAIRWARGSPRRSRGYRREGLDKREIDFSAEDVLLRALGA